MIRLLRAADRTAMAWRNGGGVTREVAIGPAGASLDSFDWRVSIAEVREAGPFSVFAGVDRMIVILEGRLALTFDDRAVELATDSAPFPFPGDDMCAAKPLGRPVTDLNVMVRRGHAVAQVERIAQATTLMTAKTMLVVASAPTSVRLGGQELSLQPSDAALIEDPAEPQLSLSGAACVIRIA
jgi:uncharacterized protein